MAAGNDTKARKRVRPRNRQGFNQKLPSPEALAKTLECFSDAIAIIEVSYRSMASSDDWPVEASPVGVGLKMLNQVYNEFDRAINAIWLDAKR